MNLYYWDSETLKRYSDGYILVMANTVDEARQKVLEFYKPYQKGHATEDPFIAMMYGFGDEEWKEVYEDRLAMLRVDIEKEPTILNEGVSMIYGSE